MNKFLTHVNQENISNLKMMVSLETGGATVSQQRQSTWQINC